MPRLPVPQPVSGGILLTYKCPSECKHCMYACSPRLEADWISPDDAEKILVQLSNAFKKSYSPGFNRLGINLGLHFTGGEPFLDFSLLLRLVKIAGRLEIPSTFVETNCFWSVDDETARDKLVQLRDAGLLGILISVNPFILEHVAFKRTQTAIRISKEVFGGNVMIYQELFRHQLERFKVKDTMPFEEYLQKAGASSVHYTELIPMGRACYRLGHLYRKHPPHRFFGDSCKEEMTRPWHIHVDNYCNYMPGYCGGISLGDARNLDLICQGVELDEHRVIAKLVSPRGIEKLYRLGVEEFSYKDLKDGYVSKCHLCVDIRKHLSEQTDQFTELRPQEFYRSLRDRSIA
jgi:MoaA/NifB/PqqE/SkfB family radical SAM enzyme